jgi:hypothetical protein
VTAGAALLAVGLVAVLGRGPAHRTTAASSGPAPASAPRVIRTASYTLISDSTGKVKLTIDPTKLFDPAALQHDLARDGIRPR